MAKAGAIRAGRAYVEMFLDSTALERGLKRIQARLKAFSASMRMAGQRLFSGGLMASLPFALATKVFSDFDDQMRATGAAVGATQKEFEALTATAKRLGRETSFTATQVAAAMFELGKAGLNAQQINVAIGDMLNLARAGGLELQTAAEIATNAANSFGLGADEFARVADVLAMAANRSTTSVENIGEALTYVSATAANDAGQSLEEVSAAIALLASRGVDASIAGTSLNQALVQMVKNTDKLNKLGVGPFDKAGNFRPVLDIMRELGEATKNMSQKERLGILQDIFDIRGARAASILASVGNAAQQLRDDLHSAAGSAALMARQMDAGIGGAIRRMISAIEGFAIAVGEAVSEPLHDLLDVLVPIIASVTKWVGENKAIVASMAILAGTAVVVGASLTILGTVLSAIASTFASIPGLVALGTIAFLKFTESGRAAFGWIMDQLSELSRRFTEVMKGIGEAIKLGDFKFAGKILWQFILVEGQRALVFLSTIFTSIKTAAIMKMNTFLAGVKVIGVRIYYFFEQIVQRIIGLFTTYVRPALIDLTADIDHTFSKITGKQPAQIEAQRELAKQKLGQARIGQRRDVEDSMLAEEKAVADIQNKAANANKALSDALPMAKIAAAGEAFVKLLGLEKELNEMLTIIPDMRKNAELEGVGIGGGGGRKQAGDLDLEGMSDAVKSIGTFNAGVINRLGFGNSPESRTAKATEATAKGMKTVEQLLQESLRAQRAADRRVRQAFI